MARVVHFEVHAEEPQRAIAFYETALGWTFSELVPGEYWLINTGADGEPGINGGLIKRKGAGPEPDAKLPVIAYVCTVQVKALDTYLQAVVNAGGTVVVPRHAVPGVGWSAYAKDTEGNIFGLHQPDREAP
jgi:predicted enzyme related to lactoylglutathione lyase